MKIDSSPFQRVLKILSALAGPSSNLGSGTNWFLESRRDGIAPLGWTGEPTPLPIAASLG